MHTSKFFTFVIAMTVIGTVFGLCQLAGSQQAEGPEMKTKPSKAMPKTQPATKPVHADTSLVDPIRAPDKEFIFKTTPQGDLKIHFYFPPNWKKTDKRPAIVFFFGGAFRVGAPAQFYTKAEYFASRGMVAASAAYRIKSKHNTAPDKCVEDAKSAIRWMRKNSADLGIDPEKLAGSGGSAGGHLAACAAVSPTPDASNDDLSVSAKPNVLILFNPVTDLRGPRIKDMMGGETDAEKARMAKSLSPVLYLKKGDPAVIIFYGTKDRFLPIGRDYVRKYLNLGNRAELWTAENQPHGFFNASPWHEATLLKSDEFLRSVGYLSGPATIKFPGTKAVLKNDLLEQK